MAYLQEISGFFAGWDKDDWRVFSWSMFFICLVFFCGIVPWFIGWFMFFKWIF